MYIQTNTAANGAFTNLSMTETTLSKALQSLSSGYRINSAGDDAAGKVSVG